jgi:hypothetical protein
LVGDSLVAISQDEEAAADKRGAAARDLIGLRTDDEDAVETVVELLTPQTAPDVAEKLLDSLRLSEAESGGEVIVEYIPSMTPGTKSAAIGVILGKPGWAKSLLAAAEAKEFDLNELSLEQKQALRSFPDRRTMARRKITN